MSDPTQTTPDQSMPEIPEEVTRFEVTGNPKTGQPEMVPSPNPLGGGYIRASDLPALYAAHRAELGERLREPIHALASGIGRGRVFADNDEPKAARRELDCAAEAMKRLRAALDTLEAGRG